MTRPTSMLNKVEQYLKFRRSLGYQLRVEGQQLQKFGAFVDAQGHHGPLTTELAVRWARLPVNVDRLYWARRLEIVRCFARYLVDCDHGRMPHSSDYWLVPASASLRPCTSLKLTPTWTAES